MAFMQSFTEDSESQTGERRLYLATYVMAAEQWIHFSDDWDAVLKTDPKIDFFTMKEAHDPMGGQFRKFTEAQRDEKLMALAKVVEKYRPFAFHTSVSRKDYEGLKNGFYPFQTPYLPLYFATLFGVARNLERWGLAEEKCRFIFDETTALPSRVVPMFDGMMGIISDEERARVEGIPDFRSDKDEIPLQAADFLAWHVRRAEEDGYPAKYRGIWETAFLVPEGHHRCTRFDRKSVEQLMQILGSFEGLSSVNRKKKWNEMNERVAKLLGQAE